jgi:uncharacterized protein YsxB (DUF464 family)
MIRCVIDKNRFSMQVSGHAGYGPAGSDIVCAAASILTATAQVELYRITGFQAEDDGETVDMICTPTPAECGRVMQAMDIIANGFRLLAGQYPENVSVTIK